MQRTMFYPLFYSLAFSVRFLFKKYIGNHCKKSTGTNNISQTTRIFLPWLSRPSPPPPQKKIEEPFSDIYFDLFQHLVRVTARAARTRPCPPSPSWRSMPPQRISSTGRSSNPPSFLQQYMLASRNVYLFRWRGYVHYEIFALVY
jgi:hypothetical protein